MRPAEPLAEVRERVLAQLASLPEPLRRLSGDPAYPVRIGAGLEALAAQVDRRRVAGRNGA